MEPEPWKSLTLGDDLAHLFRKEPWSLSHLRGHRLVHGGAHAAPQVSDPRSHIENSGFFLKSGTWQRCPKKAGPAGPWGPGTAPASCQDLGPGWSVTRWRSGCPSEAPWGTRPRPRVAAHLPRTQGRAGSEGGREVGPWGWEGRATPKAAPPPLGSRGQAECVTRSEDTCLSSQLLLVRLTLCWEKDMIFWGLVPDATVGGSLAWAEASGPSTAGRRALCPGQTPGQTQHTMMGAQ